MRQCPSSSSWAADPLKDMGAGPVLRQDLQGDLRFEAPLTFQEGTCLSEAPQEETDEPQVCSQHPALTHRPAGGGPAGGRAEVSSSC